MTAGQTKKLDKLKTILERTEGCAVAYSGGVDSSLLLAAAHEVLGDRCLAVIATSSTYPIRERNQAVSLVEERGIPYEVVQSEELDIPEFSGNPVDRCYFCKEELFTKVKTMALSRGIYYIADGTNVDDLHDHRPGSRAASELGVLTPLKDAGLNKEEIRTIARERYSLPMADKPAMACLASRFPYGSTISKEKLNQVEAVETYLFERGFRVYRARHHGEILRLELGPEEMEKLFHSDMRETFVTFAKAQGFLYVTMDLQGYRTGAMNEGIDLQ